MDVQGKRRLKTPWKTVFFKAFLPLSSGRYMFICSLAGVGIVSLEPSSGLMVIACATTHDIFSFRHKHY